MADALDDAIAAARSEVAEAAENVDDRLKQKHAADQSLIAYTVVGAFVLLLLVLTAATWLKPWPEWQEPATFLLGMITSALLPVVTLVIGYYFGKENKDK